MKTCKVCDTQKQIDEFRMVRSVRNGLIHIRTCKTCESIQANERSAWRKTPEGRVIHSKRVQQSKKNHRATTSELHARRRKSMAYPTWADKKAMRQYYLIAKYLTHELGAAFHVDHIVPLNSDNVCGLHSHDNLAVLPAFINMAKGNRTWVDMP